jgi:RNA polymerase sigma-70 factor (ECF subfamily)
LVFNLALNYTQNSQDAEEITQDVFLKVYKNRSVFQGNADLKTWIYRITINQALDFLKSKNRKKNGTIFGKGNLELDRNKLELSDFNHPGIELENKEELSRLMGAINKLPEKQQTVVVLLKIDDLSQAEVAEIMKTSSKAIESLFQRAKKQLKEILKQNEGN